MFLQVRHGETWETLFPSVSNAARWLKRNRAKLTGSYTLPAVTQMPPDELSRNAELHKRMCSPDPTDSVPDEDSEMMNDNLLFFFNDEADLDLFLTNVRGCNAAIEVRMLDCIAYAYLIKI